MKTLTIAAAILLTSFPCQSPAVPPAQVHFVCLSLRVQPGSDGFGSTLTLSSVAGAPNGELYPAGAAGYASGFSLDTFTTPVTGGLQVNLPEFVDANDNGFDDFFEVAQGVSLSVTAGNYSTYLSEGIITARWSRSAGAANGTCVFNLDDDTFGDLGDFTHTFTVLEYTGPLAYAPGSSNVIATLDLSQSGAPSQTLRGPALFSKTVPGDADSLVLRAGYWTNAAAQTLSFEETDVARDLFLGTNYYGYVAFADGDPATAGYDYPFWQLSIDDGNDADGDTIPDFSDAPTTVVRRPVLTLASGSTNLWLTISGDVARLYHLLESTNLAGGNWFTNRSLTLTNDPQTLSLPLPNQRLKFWKLHAP